MPVRNTQNDRVARIFSASFATTLVGVTPDGGVCFRGIAVVPTGTFTAGVLYEGLVRQPTRIATPSQNLSEPSINGQSCGSLRSKHNERYDSSAGTASGDSRRRRPAKRPPSHIVVRQWAAVCNSEETSDYSLECGDLSAVCLSNAAVSGIFSGPLKQG